MKLSDPLPLSSGLCRAALVSFEDNCIFPLQSGGKECIRLTYKPKEPASSDEILFIRLIRESDIFLLLKAHDKDIRTYVRTQNAVTIGDLLKLLLNTEATLDVKWQQSTSGREFKVATFAAKLTKTGEPPCHGL
jgi:hypothetical protein